jgi:hypothetical protein
LPPDPEYPLRGAHNKFLCVSYAASLSDRIAQQMSRLVQSPWYRTLWPHIQIREDQRARSDFANTLTGERISRSIEGGLIGAGGDYVLVDDPQTRRGADSEAERAASIAGMSDLTTRITDPRRSARVLVCQRLNQSDATDWALTNWPDPTHLMYPARYECDRASPGDPRTYDGELLWPEMWPEQELIAIERGLQALEGETLSQYAVAAQLQQSPIPRGGGIIPATAWRVWPESVPLPGDVKRRPDGSIEIALPMVTYVLLSLDCAMSLREAADFNAVTVFGVWSRKRELVSRPENPFAGRWQQESDPRALAERLENESENEQPRLVLMEAFRTRAPLNDETRDAKGRPLGLVQRLLDVARRRKVDMVLIENASRGQDVARELERQMRSHECNCFRRLHEATRWQEPWPASPSSVRVSSMPPLIWNSSATSSAHCRSGQKSSSGSSRSRANSKPCRTAATTIMPMPQRRPFSTCAKTGSCSLRANS